MINDSEGKFRKLADAMPQFVWTARPDGILNYTNERWTEYSGSSVPEEWHHFVHPEDIERVIPIWHESITTGRRYETEFRLKRLVDQSYRWHLVRAEADFNASGEVELWYGTCTDIDDHKNLLVDLSSARSAAEDANAAKSAFLANMSHEIRSPLGAIMGFSDLLKSSDLTKEDIANYISVIDRNSFQLLRIIDDILDLSKVEAGKMLIERIDFSLPELLADFSSLMSFKARENGITFELRVSTLLPEIITTDPTRLRQILTNIVGNAIKFTEHGRVQLTVAYTDQALEFNVSDTGRGISPEQAQKLFQPFNQGDISTTRRFGGTGLGLVLTRRLAEALGGRFFLERSTLGRGSEFVAKVSVGVAKNAKMLDSSAMTFVSQPTVLINHDSNKLSGIKILLVEDSPDNQVLFKLILSKCGAEVEIASDGYEGVNLALTNDFDVVLMDVQMPRMDGHEATQSLRKKGYDRPIIALTAHAMKEEHERALKSGFTDFLSKPIQRDTLIEMVSKFKLNSNSMQIS
jgi:signal transduction histidine kinase/CheY-like chemotaxis protein